MAQAPVNPMSLGLMEAHRRLLTSWPSVAVVAEHVRRSLAAVRGDLVVAQALNLGPVVRGQIISTVPHPVVRPLMLRGCHRVLLEALTGYRDRIT